MIDLEAVRALAERARADTADGLTAREQLADAADAMAGEIETARGLRVAHASLVPLIDKQRHCPARVRAYLTWQGWEMKRRHPESSEWGGPSGSRLLVLDSTRFSDYAKVTAMLVSDVATVLGIGELQALAEIEACDAVTRVNEAGQ